MCFQDIYYIKGYLSGQRFPCKQFALLFSFRLDPHALAPEEAGPAHLINHSIENANLIPRLYKQRGKKPRLFLVANSCIAQGQEFLYNYSFPPDSRFPFLKDCQTYNPLGNFILDSDNSEDETQGWDVTWQMLWP